VVAAEPTEVKKDVVEEEEKKMTQSWPTVHVDRLLPDDQCAHAPWNL
jgi:hypothetical protein